ncbi:carbamoyltransferase family protein [Allorhizocola rhizosphaerae]|uniref:carbamoyltransferase family protein n=1 Tax=Allorhizocola rhizosphaerae TaxID=1872709 RepID=UPI000E3B8789|nr:carbamoyltransferase C-terminal domain-containing protein [Allorhizocola rhizosphaerae]
MSRVILGLCAYTHDSAAALLVNGELVGFCEEERLDGVKHSNAFPRRAIDWLLSDAGLSTKDVTAVAYNFVPGRYLGALSQMPLHLLHSATAARAIPRARSFANVARRTQDRLRSLKQHFPNADLRPALHHRAHAWTAWLSSGYDRAGVLVVDSLGEVQTTTIWLADAGADQPLTMLSHVDDPASLGYAYGAVTEHLGWRRGDEEGTVMALAAHGDPKRFKTLMRQAIPPADDGFALNPRLLSLRILSSRYPRLSPAFVAATCSSRRPGETVEQVHADLAAALQERTQQVMVSLAARTRRLTGARLLCVGGGVAMNCVSIGTIADAGFCDEVHVPAAPGDSGTAVGAAADAWHKATGKLPTGIEGRCYLGPSFTGLSLPASPRPGMAAVKVDRPAGFLARHLADGKIVGLFTGALEAGPRALGHRSILASPLEPQVVDRLNATVKFREPFRPFAPVVLAHRASDYFRIGQPSPFMSIAAGATDYARRMLPAIVHHNGTARVQTVSASQNPFLAQVLELFGQITGHPILINTSLNIKSKPICGTPDMALDCLAESGLDALLIEGWWVTK